MVWLLQLVDNEVGEPAYTMEYKKKTDVHKMPLKRLFVKACKVNLHAGNFTLKYPLLYNMIKPFKTMSRFFIVLACCSGLLLLTSYHNEKPHKYSVKTIVIDAGHGGQDAGCGAAGVYEKHVALSIAKKLQKLLKDSLPDVKVVMTRTTDTFIELGERSNIANKAHADLFVCIHCNFNTKTTPYGTETFAMGLHKTEGNLAVAKRENDVILFEKDYEEKYEGYDPKSAESHIIFSLYQNAYLDKSLKFAALVENEFKQSSRMSRGVKQAGFLVLWRTSMPSVLIETGFISNIAERKFLASDSGQVEVSQDIFQAIRLYKLQSEKGK